MAEQSQTNTGILNKLDNLIGEGGLKTELKITLTTATMFKLIISIIISIIVAYMVISLLKKLSGAKS